MARKSTSTQWLELSPQVRVQLCLVGKRLLGLGEVRIGGVTVRAGTVPLRPDFSTLDAIHYQNFELLEVEQQGEATVLRTAALGQPEVYSNDLMDEYDFTLAFLAIREAQRDRLDWVLTPQELVLDGETFAGFSLGFRFASETSVIHRFTVVGTWEIGGQATGNTIYHQSQVAQPIYEGAIDTHFTTACLKRLDLWHSWQGNSYQLCPRWASMQPFDFQSAAAGVLVGYWPERHAVKSLIQKNPGEDVIHVLDEYAFPSGREVEIPAKHILFSPAPEGRPRERHEVVNLWTRVMDRVIQTICGYFGIKHCVPLPYGRNELFSSGRVNVDRSELAAGPQPDWRWREENGKFYFLPDGGDKVESRDLLRWMADHVLPRLKANGMKRLWLDPVHESDFTELAFAYHAQTGWHGDLHVSSVCGTHRYVPSAFFGGWDAWREFAGQAQKLGISLGHWVGLHISPRAAILQTHPEYALIHAHTKMFGGGYGHNTIVSMDWGCQGLRDWMLADLRRWHDEGLEWLWFDSWPNMTCLPMSYGTQMQPMQWEVCQVFAELQKIGYNWFGFEGTSPFGTHAYGLADPMQDYEGHVQQGVCGQNDFGKWIGHEYMAYNQALLGVELNARRDLAALPEWRFRYLANRSLNLVEGKDVLTYQALVPLMQKRYLLPADQGVRWEAGNGHQALFAFRAFAFPVAPGTKVAAVAGAVETPVACPGNLLQTEPFTAYRIVPRG